MIFLILSLASVSIVLIMSAVALMLLNVAFDLKIDKIVILTLLASMPPIAISGIILIFNIQYHWIPMGFK